MLEALSTERKLIGLWFFSMTMRQATILGGPAMVCMIFFTLTPFLGGVNIWASVAFFGPLMGLSAALAFVRWEGRTLEWHLWRWWISWRNPSVLMWRHRPPWMLEDHEDMHDSIQSYLPQAGVSSPLARSKDGTRYLVLKVFRQPSISLAGERDKDRLWARSKDLLDALDFDIVEILDSREGHITTYGETLRERLAKTLTYDQHKLITFARQHLRHVEEVVEGGNVFERIGYVVLPYNPRTEDEEVASGVGEALILALLKPIKKLLGRDHPTPEDAAALQEEEEAALAVLTERASLVDDYYSGMGVSLRWLLGDELTAFLRGQATDEEGESESPDDAIIRHDGGDYEKVPEHKREAIHAAAKAAQERAPLAPASGFLTLPDKIAPDCIEREDDWIKVGDTYRTYLMIWDWPKKVKFPQLHSLATMRGRIKLVKYIRPIPEDVAFDLWGKELARLEAGEETAKTGHVIEVKKRKSAAEQAEKGVDELVEGKQRYLEVSFYVEVQAPTLPELKTLRKHVETKIKGAKAKPMLARKEMWEAYISCMGVADDRLTKRYARKGFLSEPLADFQLFVSHQVNHETGVFLGVDPENSHPITLDTRLLPNQHVIILGVPGVGKTFLMKVWQSRIRCHDEAVFVIDPRGNSGYQRVAAALDGLYIPFGIGSNKHINPWDIADYLNLELLRALAGDDVEGLDPERVAWARQKARKAAFDGKCNSIRRLISIMSQGEAGDGMLDSEEEGEADQLIRLTYYAKNITEDPDTHDQHEPPTFEDFFETFEKEIERREEEEDDEAGAERLKRMRARLRLWETGSLRTLFGRTNVKLNNKYCVFHLGRLEGREKGAMYFALQDFLIPRLSDPAEPTNLFDDEMWDIVSFPIAAQAHMEQYRTGRARNNRMIGASQDVEEFLASKDGRTILALPQTKIALQLPRNPVEQFAKYVDISEDQKEAIGGLAIGHAHLVVGNNQVPLKVEASEFEKRLFNTDPVKEKEFKRREAVRGISGPVEVLERASDEAEGDPFEDDGGKRLTEAGRMRRLLAPDAEEATARPDDYEDVPEEELLPDELSETLVPERPEGQEAPLVAVTGPSAGLVAFNLAGYLAENARSDGKAEGRKVLFVDADGYVSSRLLARAAHGAGIPPADSTCVEGGRFARQRTLTEHSTGLEVLLAPDDEDLEAYPIVRAALGTDYDLVVVACGRSTYATQWLSESDRAVVAGSGYLHENVARAEDSRGRDGTLVVAMGGGEVPDSLVGRTVLQMPQEDAEAFKEAERREIFAAVIDEAVAAATGELARELLLVGDPSGESDNTTSSSNSSVGEDTEPFTEDGLA
jgi:hypothetical protein